MVVNTSKPRWFRNVDVLDTVAARVQSEFQLYTNKVSVQNFTVDDASYKNVIASFGPENADRIIVGAHYDVCGEQDGADDNASGVAGILELARLFKDKPLKYRIDLVAYSTEEPPFFGTKNMGSYVHARSLYDGKASVLGMVSLEMIGYYSDDKNSQHYPVGILKMFYGDKGDFITIAQKSFGGRFARQFKRIAFENNSISTKSFKAPSFFGGINLSDHGNYWKFGYSAVMITNSSFYRNHNYHKVTDRIPTLDIDRMALTIDGVYRTLIAFE
jgi:Zn-dependent M28 family amino/carboxypeptidase